MYIVVNYNDCDIAPKSFNNENLLGDYLLTLKISFKKAIMQNTWNEGIKVFAYDNEFDYLDLPVLKSNKVLILLVEKEWESDDKYPIALFPDIASAKIHRNNVYSEHPEDFYVKPLPFYSKPAKCKDCNHLVDDYDDADNYPDVFCNHNDESMTPEESGIDITKPIPEWCPLNKEEG